jgi:hypothetical protein
LQQAENSKRNRLCFVLVASGGHITAIFLSLPVAKSCRVCYSDQGRLEEFSRRKSGVALATGRVSFLEVQATDTVSAGSRSSNASSPVRQFFQYPTNFGSGGALSKMSLGPNGFRGR